MPAVVEQRIHRLRIADLAHLALFVCDLPISRAFTPLLALLVAADVFVAGALFDEDALPMLFVVCPAAGVGVAIGVRAGTLGVFFAGPSRACEKWAGVGVPSGCDVGAGARIQTLEKAATVVLEAEG
jgi:hypothetical protein